MCMRQERDLEKEKKGGRDKREIKKWGGGRRSWKSTPGSPA